MGTEVDNDAPVEPVNADSPKTSTSREQDDLKAASKAMTDYSEFMPVLRPKKKWHRVVGWAILALIILVVAGGGGYWAVKHVQASNKADASKNTTTLVIEKTSPATKQYTSNNFNLSFTYPKNWTVSDTGNGKLTVASQPMTLTDANGKTQTGVVVMDIENQGSADLSGFSTGSALAVLNSQMLSYSSPTGTQNADTYISFVQYNTATIKGTLDGIYVTGNFGYQEGQSIPESDINQIDPMIRVIFSHCTNAKCTATEPMRLSVTMWSQPNFANPIETMLESLQIQ